MYLIYFVTLFLFVANLLRDCRFFIVAFSGINQSIRRQLDANLALIIF